MKWKQVSDTNYLRFKIYIKLPEYARFSLREGFMLKTPYNSLGFRFFEDFGGAAYS